MLQEMAGSWSPARVAALIGGGGVDDDAADRTARFIKDRPRLWNVSDEEFIAAVAVVDPASAAALAAPAGIAFLHRMSRAVAVRGAVLKVRGLFGG